MHAPSKILVPIDLSDCASLGLDYAAMLANVFDAELVLVCNVNAPERADLELVAADEGLDTEAAGHLLLRQLAAERAPGAVVETLLPEHESPAIGVLEAAARSGADMIVIASHGRTGMSRWLLGSVAEKIARSADVPVIVVPSRLEDRHR